MKDRSLSQIPGGWLVRIYTPDGVVTRTFTERKYGGETARALAQELWGGTEMPKVRRRATRRAVALVAIRVKGRLKGWAVAWKREGVRCKKTFLFSEDSSALRLARRYRNKMDRTIRRLDNSNKERS